MLDLKGKKVVVTGGAGFIGSHLVESLLRLGAKVLVFDNFDPFYGNKEENLAGISDQPRLKVVRGNILDAEQVRTIMKGTHVVFHLAAQAGIRYCIADPRKAHEVNVTGTLNVALAAKEAGVRKLVYASSSSIFGKPMRVPIAEDHPLIPTSIYGATKLAAEKYCMSLGETMGIGVTCLRYFSVYGPRGRPDQEVTAFTSTVTRGESPVIYGDGTQSRDFTFVSDIVSATVLSALMEEAEGKIMNVGYGRETRITEVARRILDHFHSDLDIDFRQGYAGDFPRTLCDNRRAKDLLSWRPQVDFREGLEQYLTWFEQRKAMPVPAEPRGGQEMKLRRTS